MNIFLFRELFIVDEDVEMADPFKGRGICIR